MAAVFTVVAVVAVLLLGYYLFEKDDDHDEWRGY